MLQTNSKKIYAKALAAKPLGKPNPGDKPQIFIQKPASIN